MSSQKKIVGESITVYMDGGWTLSGVVKTSEENKLVISNDGELYLIFKNKVCAMKLSEEKVSKRPEPMRVSEKKSRFPENKLQYNEQTMSIPNSLLNIDENSNNDFSISFGGRSEVNGNETGGIRFDLDEDT